MPLRRPILVAALAAAAYPAAALHGATLDAVAVPAGQDTAQVTPAAGLAPYRIAEASGETRPGTRLAIATTLRPAVAPGTLSWLDRGASEPLAASYAAPLAARKEMGFSYSSDGRMNAYLAERARPGSEALTAGSGCCSPATDAASPAEHHAHGGASRAVASLLGQLKTRGLKLKLDDGWKVTAGARSREYASNGLKSRIAHVTLQRWWGDVSTGYSFQVEKRGGWNVAPSQSLHLGYAYGPRSTVGVAYTFGQEHAFFGWRGMLKTEVRSLALQAEHAVEKHWSVRFDAGYYDHGDLPAHRGIRIAFRRHLW